jgi:hypothetical protein
MQPQRYVQIRDLSWDEPRPVIFIHGDVDGMVTACVLVRSRGPEAEVRFSGARRIAGDLQALADRIGEGLPVSEVLIGNVPVRPATIGAVRQVLTRDVPVVWVDHHSTRQNLLDEVNAIDGVTFLHDAETEEAPSTLAARVTESEDPHVQRLLSVSGGADSEDAWVRDRNVLLSSLIGRGDADTLRRLATEDELSDEDRAAIADHIAREAAADEFVNEVEHPVHEISGLKIVVLDARGRDVGYLPRRVEARFGDVDLRVIASDEDTIVVTSSERGRDLVRLLRALPWPSGTFVGGRPHQARITPGPSGIDTALEILGDAASWPKDINAAATRPPRDNRRGGRRRGPRMDEGGGSARTFFERVVEQRVIADLLEVALQNETPLEVYRGNEAGGCAMLVLDTGKTSRHVALYCSRATANVEAAPVPPGVLDTRDGCLVWALAAEDPDDGWLDVSFRWFGKGPNQRPPQASGRFIPADRFAPVRTIDGLVERLFGWS